MTQSALTEQQEQALLNRPHLAFVIECLGLSTLLENSTGPALMDHLDRCLKALISEERPNSSLDRWLHQADQEFRSLPEGEFPVLLAACAGNTMPEWLRSKVRAELGDDVTELITRCLEC